MNPPSSSRGPRDVRCTLLGVLAFVVSTAAALPAAASNAAVCRSSYVRGQQLRMHGQLRDAREQLVTCASGECDSFIQEDCIRWLAELDQALPTVVVEVVTADGTDVTGGARVLVDGVPLAGELGLAHPLDPGMRRFRVEPADGSSALERSVVIQEGAKAKRIRFVVPGATTRQPRGVEEIPTVTSRPVPLLVWVGGALGVAALGFGIPLDLNAIARAQSFNASCPAAGGTASQCPADRALDIHRQAVIGYTLLGAGAVLAGGAVTLYLLRPTVKVAVSAMAGPAAVVVLSL